MFGLPLLIWFGILTLLAIIITACFGIAFHKFHKPVLRWHIRFAVITLILAFTHATLATLGWFFGIIV